MKLLVLLSLLGFGSLLAEASPRQARCVRLQMTSNLQAESVSPLVQAITQKEILLDARPLPHTFVDGAHTINGRPARFMDPGSLSGANQNDGIFFYTASDGTKRVVKLLPAREELGLPDEFYAMASLETIKGNLVTEALGGAKIHGYGRVQLGDKNRIYVEMEELFPNDPKKSVRDMLVSGSPEEKAILRRRDAQGRTPLDEMAAKLVQSFDSGTPPDDMDFMLNLRTGQIRWFDAWQSADMSISNARQADYLAQTTDNLLGLLAKNDPRAAARFLSTWTLALKKSKALDEPFKLEIIRELNALIPDRYKRILAIYPRL